MKTKLLLTTALIAVLSTPAMAAENQGWFDTMKQSVKTWWTGEEQTSPEVEAYLDEVTIAVPPMTGEDAAAIMPAAGDYIEEPETAPTAPGSMQYEAPQTPVTDETSFNTEFSNTEGSVTAFGDTMNADDLANIMPAAGDAEEVNDDSIVVAEEEVATEAEVVAEAEVEATVDATETLSDAQNMAAEATDMAAEANTIAENATKMTEEANAKAEAAVEKAAEANAMATGTVTEIEKLAPAAGADASVETSTEATVE